MTLVPNLFGKPTIIGFGGGKLNGNLNGIVEASAWVETVQVNFNDDGTIASLDQSLLQDWKLALGANVQALEDKLVIMESGQVYI